MTATAIIREMNKLSLGEKLLLVEKTLQAIRREKEHALEQGVSALCDEYKSNKELTVFTNIDSDAFYEAR